MWRTTNPLSCRSLAARLCAALLVLAGCGTENPNGGLTDLRPQFGVDGVPNKQDWKQCQNNQSYADDCDWTTGNLNQTHNTYAEGDFVPKVLRIPQINNGDPIVVELKYGFLKGGQTTHDFLGLWNEDMVNANPCTDGSFTGFCTAGALNAITATSNTMGALSQAAANAACGAGSQHAIDMAEAIAAAGAAKLVVQGVNVSSINVTNIVFDGCPATGDADATITMTVTPNAAGVSSEHLLLLFGAHVARGLEWDNGGASDVEGSPYHVSLESVGGIGTGSMDLQMAAGSIVAQPDLVIEKTANPAGPVSAGSNIGFDITVTNNGPGDALDVTVTDTLPAGFAWTDDSADCTIVDGALGEKILNCDVGTLGVEESFTVNLTSPTDSADCGVVNNRAWADAGNDDPISDDASVTVQCPNLVIVKTANPVGPVTAGNNIGFDIAVTNNGPGAALGVTIVDTLPAGFSWTDNQAVCAITDGALAEKILNCTVGDLADDASFTVTVTSPTDPADCSVVNNRAWADATNQAPVNDDASVTVQCPDLVIVKTANPIGPVPAGNNIGFDITVTNNGPGAALGVTIVDTLPAGFAWTDNQTVCAISDGALAEKILNCTVGDLADDASFALTVTSPTDPADCGVVANRAWADATNDAAVNDDASVTVQCPNLSITKTANPVGPVTAGNNIGFDITVTNGGPSSAEGVTIVDTLPAGFSWTDNKTECTIDDGALGEKILNCAVGTLADDASFTVNVTSPTDPADCGVVSNRAWADASNNDPVSDDASVTVQCPNLSITKTANPVGPVTAGSNIGFDITVANGGPGSAEGVTIVDTLPAGFSWTDNKTECTINDGALGEKILSCTVGTLADDASFSVTVTTPTDQADCSVVNNLAWADATNDDAVSDGASVTVQCPNLSITKTANPVGPVAAGNNIGFDLTVLNGGPGSALGVTIVDTLPAGFTWTDNKAECTIGTGALGEKILNCTVGTLADDASFSVTVTSPTDPADCGVVNNLAWADASNDDPVSDGASVTINCPAPGATLLIIDEDGIDNGLRFNDEGGPVIPDGPDFFSVLGVNDDRPGIRQRAVLRYFAENIGRVITVVTGQTGDEAWFAPNCIPSKWVSGNGNTCLTDAARQTGIGNYFGLNGPAAIPPQSKLDKIPAVIPLRALGLNSLEGHDVCAVVYDSDVSINYDFNQFPWTTGNLQGELLGIVAFHVIETRTLNGFSSSTLPEVQIRILNTNVCGAFQLFNAPVPTSSSVPNDRVAPGSAAGYRALLTRAGLPLFY